MARGITADRCLPEVHQFCIERIQHNTSFGVWRCHMPDKRYPMIMRDSVVVGWIDQHAPEVPAEPIVLQVYLVPLSRQKGVTFDFSYGDHSCAETVLLTDERHVLDTAKEYAGKLWVL